MTWFEDLGILESFGFLRGQATPFSIQPSNSGILYAWHILPIGLYRQHELALTAEPCGFKSNVTTRLSSKLLRDDPETRLMIHMHGAAGTIGSGYRVPNYRALSAGHPSKIHVLTFDYWGFGRSRGTSSENGLCLDAIAVVDWAIKVAGVPPSRILVFGQSLGTAVSLAVAEHFALQSPPVVFAGHILVAPFVDVATLVATYRVASFIPIILPLAKFSTLFKYLSTFIRDKWSSKDRIAADDYSVPSYHNEMVFWHAVNAMVPQGISFEQLEKVKLESKRDLGSAGLVMEWRTENGLVREEILKTGLHDVIMSNPVVSMAVMRIFEAADPPLEQH